MAGGSLDFSEQLPVVTPRQGRTYVRCFVSQGSAVWFTGGLPVKHQTRNRPSDSPFPNLWYEDSTYDSRQPRTKRRHCCAGSRFRLFQERKTPLHMARKAATHLRWSRSPAPDRPHRYRPTLPRPSRAGIDPFRGACGGRPRRTDGPRHAPGVCRVGRDDACEPGNMTTLEHRKRAAGSAVATW